ncbi:MAG: inorganic diphosphatase [Firmicutes bacterium]|nr:inorganic diphosphatase [Bacillota bacterium]
MNPWHDISDERIKPEEFLSVIEIPKGSKHKYEIDKESGMLFYDRLFVCSMIYPANYGFIPRTLSEDGDALDVLVLGNEVMPPLTLIKCAPIGVIEMIDNGEMDEKIIAVPLYKNSRPAEKYKDITDLQKYMMEDIKHFVIHYKDLEKDNQVKINAIKGKEDAMKIIVDAKKRYKSKFLLA